MLMILLTIIAVGLLSLSAISLRSTSRGEAAAVARSNARMALMLAIGELQKQTGPDKRVTASSSIVQGNTGKAPANDKWVGVWRTDGLKDDSTSKSFLVADVRNGSGYSDTRSKGGAYDKTAQCLAWLVSGDNPDPSTSLPVSSSVEVRSGKDPIRVPKVVVQNTIPGTFAYFVSDESTKARINLADPFAPSQPAPADPGGDGMKRWLAPQTADPTVFFNGTTLDLDEAGKVASRRQLKLSTITSGETPGGVRDYGKLHDHEFTTYGRSVLADPVQGGLKGDLTAYLEDNAAASLGPIRGITDATNINSDLSTTRTKSGTKFGMLRNWYELRKSVSQTGNKAVIDARIPTSVAAGKIRIVDPGSGYVNPLVQPVMTEATYYQNHVVDGDASAMKMVELIYPRIVLWNPFSVSLKTQGHIVYFDFLLRQTISCTFSKTTGESAAKSLVYDATGDPNKRLGFYIPPTEFAPGEALVFCAPSKNRPFIDTDLRSNILSAAASPSDLGCFSRNWSNGDLGAGVVRSSLVMNYTFNNNIFWNFGKTDGRTQTITLHALTGSSAVTGSSLMSTSGPVAVRQLSLDNYSRGNNGRWLPQYTRKNISSLTETLDGGIPPDSLLAFGGRYRFLYESFANRTQGAPFNEPWYYAPLAHHNINAPNIHRWPNDNIFGLQYNAVSGTGGNGPHLYSYGTLAQARQWSEWLDSEVMPHRGPTGKYRTAVFSDASFATSDTVCPVYDIPLPDVPLVSLGALQQVPVSPFAWHPSHVIGNSMASPFLPISNATSNSKASEARLWSDKTSHLLTNSDITGFDQIPNEVLINDLSFELNQALWDRYFLSAIPRAGQGWQGSRWNPAKPLPNSRLTINSSLSDSGSRSELLDFHHAARSLWLEGGFNVNSTSINAWKSLLRSFRPVDVPTSAGSTAAGGTAFPGQLISRGSASNAAQDPSMDHFWRDYRSLSDSEVDLLAAAIVEQVRLRAPFAGVADFVNRRLADASDAARLGFAFGGTIQTALDNTRTINETRSPNKDLVLPTAREATTYTYGASYWGGPIATPEPQTYQVFQDASGSSVRQKGAGAASQVTQADILQHIGSVLVARGDTFVVRAYGEAKDASGKVIGTAWCEAVVQRTPVPVNPDPASDNLNPLIRSNQIDWGRRYEIESFRWLDNSEI